MPFPIPENEKERLAAVDSYGILDTMPEQEYDDITLLAAHICNTKISTIALIDKNRKWHKSKFGLDKDAVPREMAICSYTIMADEPLIINDTHDHEIFHSIGMVTGPPYVRFYAGVPLINSQGFALGTLCVVDVEPRQIDSFQRDTLLALGRQTMTLIEFRRTVLELEAKQEELNVLNQQLTEISLTDDLTGILNRRALREEMRREISRSLRYNHPLAVIMLDIDGFKQLNDNHGHSSGDQAIKRLATILTSEVRGIDRCFRYGGDEFIVLMPLSNDQQAENVANRIRKKIKEAVGIPQPISASIGITIVKGTEISEDDLLRTVDRCLYSAKQRGGDSIVFGSV